MGTAKNRVFGIAIMVLLAFMLLISTASAYSQTYIVHLERSKIKTLFASPGTSKQWYEAVLDSVTELSSQEDDEQEANPPELLYVYETVIFGFAAKLSAKHMASLSKIDGFLFATPDQQISLQTTRTPQFLGLEKGKGLWHASRLASDVIIGFVDSGIWPEHPSFQDHGLPPVPSRWKGTCKKGSKFSPSNCNRKLIGARFYSKGFEFTNGKVNETEEYKSARDAGGHGTHCASTAAGAIVEDANLFGFANGTATGVAYASRIAMYKACWQSSSSDPCRHVDILEALEDAIEDGVDVLSLSIAGKAEPYYQDIIAIASYVAVKRGIFVSCAGGNFGPEKSTVSNTAPWIMTVAASTLDRSFPTDVKLGNGQVFEGASLYNGKPTKQLPIVYGKTAGGHGAEYCIPGSLSPKLVSGKIVACQRGKVSPVAMGELVQLAGGAGMLLLNNAGEELRADPHVLPATSVGASAGKAIKKYINSTKSPTASIVFKGTVYGTRAPIVASFSSRGPNAVGPDVIKPDVTAPGENILAAWTARTGPSDLESDKRKVLFNIISGTSMACPHVSGIAALLKSKHKDWSPAAIKSALMTTAYTTENRGGPITDIAFNSPATPFAFGSGHVDPERASDPGLIYDITSKDYLNYFCSLKYNSSQIAMFNEKFTCPKEAVMLPGDLNYPSFSVIFKGNAHNLTVTYKRTATNVGTPTDIYTVQVEEPKGVSVMVKPKILRFKKFGERLSYQVSFTGVKRVTTFGNSSFGSLVWVSGKHTVRSPIAVTWE